MSWLEVSLEVGGEAAEAVADVFARFAPNGVAVEATQIETAPSEEQERAVGPVIVRAYLPVDLALENTRARLEEALWHLGQILPLPSARYQTVVETDWSEAWKANFQPLRIGRRLMIVPAWLNPPLAPDDSPIRLDPGMAFGTGSHPTTQLCLMALERHLTPGAALLDLGTGSGVLAIAAAKLQASRPGAILALDIDDEAVRVARENVAANGVADLVRVEHGSLAEVVGGDFGPGWRSARLVVANILTRVIIQLLEQGLAQSVGQGGLMVLSGILRAQAYEVVAALKTCGMEIVAQEQIEDWVAIISRK